MTVAGPDLDYLIRLATEQGEEIVRAFYLPQTRFRKGDGSTLTKTDTAINKAIIDQMERDFPHVSVLGEELGRFVEGADMALAVDPIDGTTRFVVGQTTITIILALLRQGRPVISVVHNPFTKETWCAVEKGHGSWYIRAPQRPVRIQVSNQKDLSVSYAALSWWKGAEFNLHEVDYELMNLGVETVRGGSTGLSGALVAQGKLDCSLFASPYNWETAAIQLLVEEAGGVATDLFGDQLVYGFDGRHPQRGHLICNNAHMHRQMLEIVAKHQ